MSNTGSTGSGLCAGGLLGGRYRLLRVLGTGATGTIWQARNEAVERDYAIKVLHPSLADDRVLVQRFLLEARVAGRIRHPGIASIYDMGYARMRGASGNEGGLPFMVMDLFEGEALDSLLRSTKRLPLRAALLIALGCTRALAAAHEQGVVHRDLKAGNVFLHKEGQHIVPKVLDFGICKLLDRPANALTMTGDLLGSPSAMSPEQWQGAHSDARTDVWALGSLLFLCLTGREPFTASGVMAMAHAVTSGDAPRVRSLMPGVPAAVDEFVARCLQKDPSARFADAAAALAALEKVARSAGVGPEKQLDLATLAGTDRTSSWTAARSWSSRLTEKYGVPSVRQLGALAAAFVCSTSLALVGMDLHASHRAMARAQAPAAAPAMHAAPHAAARVAQPQPQAMAVRLSAR